ncbi:MAG TPA: MFS transporter [Gammaproteobacteria bacterium]|nr:MFS transporter [Gammaproteobacteria bacterium]
MNRAPNDERLIRWLAYLMFFTFAMTTDAVGSVIPEIIDEFMLSLTAASAFQYATMGGIAAGALLLGFLADRLGRKPTIIVGLVLYGFTSLLFAFGNNFGFFVVLLGLAGLGISVFKIGALALIGDISASTHSHTRIMNTVEGFFAVGAIVGPAIVATLISTGMSWKWLYVIAAAICVVLIVMAARVNYPQTVKPSVRADLRQGLKIMRDPLALGVSGLIVLYVAVEVAVYVWMPTYLLGYEGSFAWLPAYALTLFFVLRAGGRFLGAWFLTHVTWTTALALFGLAIFLCFLGSLVFGVEAAAWLLPLSGLFMSIMYPTLNSKGISCFPKSQHGAAAGVILFFTAAAAALGPLAMAAVSDAYGDAQAGFVLATGMAFLMLAGLVGNWVFDPARRRLQTSDREDYDTEAATLPLS